jgi:hypothetical protein
VKSAETLLLIKFILVIRNEEEPVYISGTALGYGLDDRWVESRQRLGSFLFTTASKQALGLTQPPIQWVPGDLSLEVKRPGRQADQSPPSSADVKNAWNYASPPPIHFHGVVLSYKKIAQRQLYFYLNIRNGVPKTYVLLLFKSADMGRWVMRVKPSHPYISH